MTKTERELIEAVVRAYSSLTALLKNILEKEKIKERLDK